MSGEGDYADGCQGRPPFNWRAVLFAAAILGVAIVIRFLVLPNLENGTPPPLPHPQSFAAQHAVPRSGHWPKVRAEYLAKHPTCQACGRTAKQSGQAIEVHHVVPFSVDAGKELDEENLIALCRRCHELLAHLDKWSSHNADVREDCERMLKKIKERP
jgi:hypothetical protein